MDLVARSIATLSAGSLILALAVPMALARATGLDTAVWSSTICPDGTNSDANGGTCLGHLE